MKFNYLIKILLINSLFMFNFCYSSLDDELEDNDTPSQVKKLKDFSLVFPSPEIKDGVFYRHNGDQLNLSITAVYSKEVNYRDINLSESEEYTTLVSKIEGRGDAKNILNVIFFGVWTGKYEQQGKIIKEKIYIEVPLRELRDGSMYPNERTQNCRPFWKTGHGEKVKIKEDGKKLVILPCKGKHTEDEFLEFIKQTNTQEALWKYFLTVSNSDETIKLITTKKKLGLIGFKFYSSNDACDECYKKILNLQINYKTELRKLIPQGFEKTQGQEIAFLNLFFANRFYHPQNDKQYGSSLFFYPVIIKSLRKLSGNQGNYFDSYETQKAKKGEEEVNHLDKIIIKKLKQPRFIIIQINKGVGIQVH